MVETKTRHEFEATVENDLFLSFVEEAWHSKVINTALNQYLSKEALIDIADGNGVVSFWRKLNQKKKAEVLRRFGDEGTETERADPDLWQVVSKSDPMDFFHMAAKYLKLHQLKHGEVWTASKEITGAEPGKK